eukprot:TCALIF_06396-PA protein Name:"Similar to Trappc13 Trafficking protein particle complex subunit 13 (Rattus norvegicus)" AED:0.10 eAED:0.10 QI:103/0.83/0.85/1/0.83/0.85/7/522/367
MATPSPAAPSTPNMANTQVEHPLALKVMRLTRPTLATPIVITNDPDRDMLKDTMNQDLAQDPNALSGLTSLALGQSLVLPQSFGSIYLGETFTSYVSLRNDSTEACQKVWLNCDLQTSTQRIPLYPGTSGEHPASAESFLSGQSLDHVLLHEVKELGPHILACEVSYSLPGRERRSFRKFFKFQVLKPLDVKTKFYNAESDEVFLEAQVQNVTTGPLCLEQVLLDPSPSFKVSAMNSLEEDKSVFGKVNFLQAQDSRQYLFCLTPKPEAKLNHLAMKGITNIELDLNLVNMKQPQLAWSGITTRKLGLLEPGGNLEISIEIIPRDVGLQLISGIRITDSLLKRNYEFDDVCQVFVCRDEEMISTLGI